MAFKVLMESLKEKYLKSNSYTVDGFIQVIQVWVYYALSELGASMGNPVPNRPSQTVAGLQGLQRTHMF